MITLAVTILTILPLMITANGQTFIDQIRVDQKMPKKINIGGYTENKSEDCSCRIFSINYNVQSWETGGGGADLEKYLEFTTTKMTQLWVS